MTAKLCETHVSVSIKVALDPCYVGPKVALVQWGPGPFGTGWIQGERSELRYVLASYWMPTLRVSSDDYSFRRTGVILDAYFKSMLPTL